MGYVTAIHLYVTDLDYAIDFYTRLLGFGPRQPTTRERTPTARSSSSTSVPTSS